MMSERSPIPTSLYIHTPWCAKKCPYCDFNSHTSAEALPEADYLKALLNDLDQDLHQHDVSTLHSIFIGGGTPSLLSGRFYAELLEQIEKRVSFAHHIEITLEANPGTTEAQKFLDFRAAGINRLSIGVQSFNDAHLKKLGRIHSADDAKRAIQQAAAHFHQINIDLMFGLEHQTEAEALSDLTQAIEFETTHLSWYQLTIEPNTHFYKQTPPLPNPDALADIQASGQTLLAQHGFNQYEISAYCKSNMHCKHNLNYWQFGDYLGIGAGAHGKISHPSQEDGSLMIHRTQKTRLPQHYLTHFKTSSPEKSAKRITLVNRDEYIFEFLLNALRLREGFSTRLAQHRAELSEQQIITAIPSAYDHKLLTLEQGRIQPTPFGWNHINAVLELLV